MKNFANSLQLFFAAYPFFLDACLISIDFIFFTGTMALAKACSAGEKKNIGSPYAWGRLGDGKGEFN